MCVARVLINLMMTKRAFMGKQTGDVVWPPDKSTVFIGSSRIKFDLDIDTWEGITGDHAIQLACVGSTPIPV